MLEIYTDGACSRNGTPEAKASWGYVVVDNGVDTVTGCGRVEGKQSNNTGELQAIAEAVSYAIKENHESLLIYSDSRYCIDSLTIWNIEKRKKGKKKANYDQIKGILTLMEEIDVSFEWVRGHDGNYFNEIADQLANNLVAL